LPSGVIEFETVDDLDAVAQPDVLRPQVAGPVDDATVANPL
jgi:hypothetical protein